MNAKKNWVTQVFDSLLGPSEAARPTTPRTYTRAELLDATGITARQLSYYIKLGVVDRPTGRTRAAKYTNNHRLQVSRVADLLKRSDMTVTEIADAYSRIKRRSNRKTSPAHSNGKNPRVQHVFQVTEGVSIVYSEELLASERVILARMKKAAIQSDKERLRLLAESLEREK
ncbi:MAG: hypothetical protein RI988_3049 [Pseudomonadota bacterium]|jgi:DNA-binding transcriptional MerR regulator